MSRLQTFTLGGVLLAGLGSALPGVTSAAVPAPEFGARIAGYADIGVTEIPVAERAAIKVVRNDAQMRAEASGEISAVQVTAVPPADRGRQLFSSVAAEGFARSTPGVLSVFGGNRAIALPAIGLPQFELQSVPNEAHHYTSIFAEATFIDYLTVAVEGEALGTPVQVPFQFAVEATSDYPLGFPVFGARPIKFDSSFSVSGFPTQLVGSDGPGPSPVRTELGNGLGAYELRSREFLVPSRVGDVITVSARLTVQGQADIFSPVDGLQEWGGFVDARNTAALWLGTLPTGMTLTSASGHDYRIDPTVTAVPLPAAHTLLLSALCLLRRLQPRSDVDLGQTLASAHTSSCP